MKVTRRIGWRVALMLLAVAPLALATTTPMPGTLNYLEGSASVNGQPLSGKSAGQTQIGQDQVIQTGQGNAEVLLTPGVFLRLGHDSSVRMLSLGLADTSVSLEHGAAMLEVDQLYKENRLKVALGGSTTRIEKTGLYAFHTDPLSVSVVDGKAEVDQNDGHVTLKKGHEVELASARPLKAVSFDKQALENDPLYRWSDLRADYESQANLDAARTVVVNGGWYGAGWYWDPFWDCYAFLPGAGPFYSPFGWGFYSPYWVWGHGYIGGPRRWGGNPGHWHGGGGRFTQPVIPPRVGFHGGMGGFHGGGFHGGAGRRG